MLRSENQSCPICCETFSKWNHKNSLRSCCQKKVCNDCMYRHIKSVFSEGFVGDGRTTLMCPLGCNESITDHDIRDTIQRANYSIMYHVFGRLWFTFLYAIGCFYSSSGHDDLYAKNFQKWTKSESEKEDLRIYERWNIAIAMMNVTSQSEELNNSKDEIYMRCPAPDCDYIWISSLRYQKKKLKNEKAASNLIMYFPPKHETTTEVNQLWWDAEEIYLRENVLHSRRRTFISPQLRWRRPQAHQQYKRHPETKDGRRCICPKCHASFCGLCLRPWITMVRRQQQASNKSFLSSIYQQIMYQNRNHKRYFHDGKKCDTYASKLKNENNEEDANNDDAFFLAFARTTNARMCPGCSMWVERTSGCNHITCRCGTEWCFVCEKPWHNLHYGCRLEDSNGVQGTWCSIS